MSPINLLFPNAGSQSDSDNLEAASNPLFNSLTIPRTGLLVEEADGRCSLAFGSGDGK